MKIAWQLDGNVVVVTVMLTLRFSSKRHCAQVTTALELAWLSTLCSVFSSVILIKSYRHL